MPKVPLLDLASNTQSERSLSDAVFGVKPNRHVLYEAVKQYRSRQHRGTHATKNRAAVRGGGHKPWRQKGTGRARVGSTRNPLWRKGGTVFGPQPRDHSFKLPGKVQRGALRSALSLRAKEGSLVVVPSFPLEAPSTKTFKGQLNALGLEGVRVLVVDNKPSDALRLSARNLERVEVSSVAALHTYDVLLARKVVLSEEAAAGLEERLSK